MVPLSELEKGSLQPIFKKELSSAHARMTRLNQSEDFIRIHPLAGLLLAYWLKTILPTMCLHVTQFFSEKWGFLVLFCGGLAGFFLLKNRLILLKIFLFSTYVFNDLFWLIWWRHTWNWNVWKLMRKSPQCHQCDSLIRGAIFTRGVSVWPFLEIF